MPSVLRYLKPGEKIDMTDLIVERIGSAKVLAFPIHEEWMDLGRPEDITKADRHLPR